MGWFSDTFNFETLAPIAAGIILPGWGGVLAGSAIGAATSDDPLTGALTGGLGAYGGQGLASSFAPNGIASLVSSAPATTTTVAPSAFGSTAASTAGKSAATTALTNAGSSIPGAASTFTMPSLGGAGGFSAAPVSSGFTLPYSGVGAGITTPSLGGAGGFSAAPVSSGFTMPYSGAGAEITTPPLTFADKNPSFMEGLSDYGGGGKYGKFKGAGKLGLTVAGMGLGGGAFDPEPMEFETPDKYKYDPTRRLNLGDDVDSGLRLLATGGYLEGGGVGDGMSDDIPAIIDQEQPAALSEGEFVVPADVVSHLGNGSSNAGARMLYDMMATIREARTGNSKQGVEIEAEEYMPYNMAESQSRRV
jgi:hypothetical protein